MSEPPFPVPAGMTWDGEKKRFFKRIPQEIKIQPKRKSENTEKVEQDEAHCDHVYGLRSPRSVHRSSLNGMLQSTSSLLHRSTHAHSRIHKKAIVKAAFGALRHVATTSIVPWNSNGPVNHSSRCDESWKRLKIRAVQRIPNYSTLLCVQDVSGNSYLVDATGIDALESSNALLFEYWTFDNLPRRVSKRQRHEETVNYYHDRTDLVIRRADDVACRAFDIDGEFAVWCTGEVLMLADTISMENALEHTTQACEIGISGMGHEGVMIIKDCSIEHLRIRSWSVSKDVSKALIMYATQRQVGLLECLWSHHLDANKAHANVERAAFCKLKSDVICFDILPDGISFMIGLRNGEVLQYQVDCFLTKLKEPKEPVEVNGARPRCINSNQIRPTNAPVSSRFTYSKGAVTHIKAFSSQELILSYSDGTLELRNSHGWSAPIISYIGHVNSWSLNLPMTIDIPNRLLAVAGQDKMIRIWHLDDPYPLEDKVVARIEEQAPFDIANPILNSITLQQTVFAKPITALTFCPRRKVVREAAQSEDFSNIGSLPGLAIATSGAEIAFYE